MKGKFGIKKKSTQKGDISPLYIAGDGGKKLNSNVIYLFRIMVPTKLTIAEELNFYNVTNQDLILIGGGAKLLTEVIVVRFDGGSSISS